MSRKDSIDVTGAALLVLFSVLMGVNQVMIKLVNDGLSPVFQAGLRSVCALPLVIGYAWWMGKRLSIADGTFWPGILCGLFFSAEFMLLFNALEFTSVSRASVLFYTMPVWVAVAAHWLIPGEHLTPRRLTGLALALAGVALALWDRPADLAPDHLIGDVMCLIGALFWCAIALTARLTRLSSAVPEMQLGYQLAVSAVVLTAVAPMFGPILRDMTPEIAAVFSFQVIVVVAFGFVTWFWVLSRYPASDMTAFSFLAPLFGVVASWVILDEEITPAILVALALTGGGIALISWRNRSSKPDGSGHRGQT